MNVARIRNGKVVNIEVVNSIENQEGEDLLVEIKDNEQVFIGFSWNEVDGFEQPDASEIIDAVHGTADTNHTGEIISDEDAREVTPLDLLNSDNYTTKEIRDQRLDICNGCDRLFKPTKTCRECGCFMALKTWLTDASCPLGKW